MNHVNSAGIIPYSFKDGQLVFFVGHPGGNKTDYWSFLKGQVESGENNIDAALREFMEESSIDLSHCKNSLVDLGSVAQSKAKTVYAYAVRLQDISEINLSACKSNMAAGFPWPEIAKYSWMTYDEIVSKTHKTHVAFYDKIRNLENCIQ